MSTNSTIAIQKEDGSIKGVYCHWDGYLSHNGNILLNNYDTVEKVEELISLGDLSSLGEKINPDVEIIHAFDKPQAGVCVFYHRDRGESWENVKPFNAHAEIVYIKFYGQEYNYLFKEGKWFYRVSKKKWVELTQENTM